MSIYHADAGLAARAAGDPRRLQGALPAGRRDRPERDRADEPAARKDARRLRQHRRLVEALDRRGRALLPASTSPRAAKANGFTAIPPQAEWRLDPDAAYVHICSNETIIGLEYHWTPDTGAVPLVADMSSDILSRPIDVARYGLIYAGAQKNIGPAGLTLVIVRDDLLGGALPTTPSAFDYAHPGGQRLDDQHAADLSRSTSPGWSSTGSREQGGLAAMAERNRAKAALLYDCLDASGFYRTRSSPADRSLMNVRFHLPDPALDAAFLEGASARRPAQPQGPPHRRRHARLDLQRDAGRGRAGPGRYMKAFRAASRGWAAADADPGALALNMLSKSMYGSCILKCGDRHGSDRRRARPDHLAEGRARRPRLLTKGTQLKVELDGGRIILRKNVDDAISRLRGRFKLPPGVTTDDVMRELRGRAPGDPVEPDVTRRDDRGRLVRADRSARRRRPRRLRPKTAFARR